MVNAFASIGKVGTQMRVEQTSLDPDSAPDRFGQEEVSTCRRWLMRLLMTVLSGPGTRYNLVGIRPHRWSKPMAWPSLTAQISVTS
jgi:hypothetical protein